jgi:dihydroorotase
VSIIIMPHYDAVIQGVFVDPLEGVFDSRVGISRGRLKIGVGHSVRYDTICSYPENVKIFPGFICSHSHLRQCDETLPEAEDYRTGTMAAAHGGVTTVFQMPNTTPVPINTKAAYVNNMRLAEQLGVVDVKVIGGLCKEMATDKKRLQQLSDVAIALKTSTCETTGGIYLEQRYMEKIFQNIAELGIEIPGIAHCENQAMNDARMKMLKDQEYASKHCDERPPESEAIEIKYVLGLASELDLNIHIAHVSTENGMKYLIEAMDERPDKVSGEVTLHHALLNRDDMERLGPYGKMNPPLRPEKDRAAVEHELLYGNSNVWLVTDHAPHTREAKEGSKPPSGVPGLDHYGAAVSRFIKENPDVDLRRIAEITSHKAAQRFGLDDVGRIANDFVANLVAINPDNDERISKLYTKCGWAPYPVGSEDAWPETYEVWVNGKIMSVNGELIGV